MSRPEISIETIQKAVLPRTQFQFDTADLKIQKGLHFDSDYLEEAVGLPYVEGDGVTTFTPEYAMTGRTLRGRIRKLAAHSLIRAESFVIPKIIDQAQVEALMYEKENVDALHFGALTIIEPQLFHTRFQKITKYFLREYKSDQATVAEDGLEAYLNGGLISNKEGEAKIAHVASTELYMAHIIRSETEAFMASFQFNEPTDQD